MALTRVDGAILSGDFTQTAQPYEYDAALEFCRGLRDRYNLTAGQVLLVPGNHDVDWSASERAFEFVPTSRAASIPGGVEKVPAGNLGILARNDTTYYERLSNYSVFCSQVLDGMSYSLDPRKQWRIAEIGRVLFLGLNSAWECDHLHPNRVSICPGAIAEALDALNSLNSNAVIRIAVLHHPFMGSSALVSDLLQLLSVQGFKVCLHGHLHETQRIGYEYDVQRRIHILGVGTFGVDSRGQTAGIPWQYNVLTVDCDKNTIQVESRKREKRLGAWMGDARWGTKNHPSTRLRIRL